ncbi:hypothetical protein BP5796_00599 [Coleophoma crateriformis]|uniref:Uncharacterized protein n=1 Tax=Coleophoma crateriformis TaxID=565419 RepID=A0A3D8T8G3_9HELO|nr:hypothetical protein BP5796_00599 [Coleophoma crateriformis]
MVHIDPAREHLAELFTFTFALPTLEFSFDQQFGIPATTARSFKRRRALSDVDGAANEGRKKRRLRLQLITSRLSRPFSQPATNIISRGNSKISAWSRHRLRGRAELRKAAILNHIRLSVDAARSLGRYGHVHGRGAMPLKDLMEQKPRHHEMRLPPSPLGLSNYDALDLEDDMMEAMGRDEDGDGMEGTVQIYSDFNFLDPVTGDGDDYRYLDALDGIPPEDLPSAAPTPPEESILGLLREKERLDGQFICLEGRN